MIFECPEGHICFSKDNLDVCGMKGCGKSTLIISPIDIKWFYKINERGLCINKTELYKIIEDPNMPKDVKKQIKKVFFVLVLIGSRSLDFLINEVVVITDAIKFVQSSKNLSSMQGRNYLTKN
jgi:hypothetical protein